MLHGVPTLFIALLNHPKVKAGQVDFKSMKVCYAGAAPLLVETKQRFEALTGGRLLDAYGMTETMRRRRLPDSRRLQRRRGRHPDAGYGREDRRHRYGEAKSAAGETGEIISAPQTMVGYWGRPAKRRR